jgi:RNA polymerase sigma-70 factor (ECF subfamily)
MFRDVTYNDVTQVEATGGESAAFVIDEDTFRAFYDRTARGVWSYLARITGDRQLADDLLQETYYRFLRASTAYESESHRRNSLYRIATNVARDVRRRTLTHPFGVPGADVERIATGDQAGSTERATDFNRAMARLGPRDRAMLWLAYAEGASHREIAEAMGVRTASLKILLFRARKKLANLLAGRGKEPGNATH